MYTLPIDLSTAPLSVYYKEELSLSDIDDALIDELILSPKEQAIREKQWKALGIDLADLWALKETLQVSMLYFLTCTYSVG